jgi:hypothetical protein
VRVSEQDDREIRFTNLAQALGSALAVATFSYFIVCFAFVFSFSGNLDLNLVYYFSFEDYLKFGMSVNLYLVVMLTFMTFAFIAVYHSVPKDGFELTHFEFLRECVKKFTSYFVLAALFIGGVWKFFVAVGYAEDSIASTWLFWLPIAAALVFGIFSLPRNSCLYLVSFCSWSA